MDPFAAEHRNRLRFVRYWVLKAAPIMLPIFKQNILGLPQTSRQQGPLKCCHLHPNLAVQHYMPCKITEHWNRVTCLAGFNGKKLGEKQRVTTNPYLKQSSIRTDYKFL